MREEILMPKMGESVMEGTLIKWYKKVGDKVKKDEIIFEISTDKVDTEVPSPADGTLVEIFLHENETAEIGSVIAVLETDGEAVTEKAPEPEVEKTEEPKTLAPSGDELVDIPMPKMGESVMEGTIIKWYKQVGDKIKKDEIIFEISTDKVDTEVPSPVDGVLAEILFGENETAEVGEIVARISTTGKLPASSEQKGESEEYAKAFHKTVEPELVEKEESEKRERFVSNRFYSPLVLNVAKKENVSIDELARIKGTGVNDRVRKNDILKYIEERKAGKVAAPKPAVQKAAPVAPKYEKGEGVEIIPMDNIRKKIMRHMIASRDTSVHVSEMMEVDMTVIHNYIEKNRDRFLREENIKLTYMPFISMAVIKALKDFPLMNASVDGENIVMKKYVNLGIAVAVEPNGLIVPNIKNADDLSLRGLARSINEIATKARTKGLSPDDVVDGTFTITNYGVFGALFGNPIINQPEVGILGVGAVVKKPVVVELDGTDVIAIKPMMFLSLSHDHRLVDGLLGGKFLKSVKETLQNFDVSGI